MGRGAEGQIAGKNGYSWGMFGLSETGLLIGVSPFTARLLVESVYGDSRVVLSWARVMELMQLARFLPFGYTASELGEWYAWSVLEHGSEPFLSRDVVESVVASFVSDASVRVLVRDALGSFWASCGFDGSRLLRYTPVGWGGLIVLDSARRAGAPTLVGTDYRTSEIYDAYRRTHSLELLAREWNLSEREVCRAVRFQCWLLSAGA